MPINLDSASRAIERYMLDTVAITRPDPDSAVVIDPVTLEAARGRLTVYEGKALISAMGTPATIMVGNRPVVRTTYEIGIPLTAEGADDIDDDDDLNVTDAYRDVALLDLTFIITGVISTGLATHRRLSAYTDRPVK